MNESATEPVTYTDEPAEAGRRPRRLLRGFVAMLVLVAVLLGAIVVYQIQQFLSWVSGVETRGGYVVAVVSVEGSWPHRVFGDRLMLAFDEIWLVELVDATDEDLRTLTRRENLSLTPHLTLQKPRLSAEGWQKLGDLKSLVSLELINDDSLLEQRDVLPRLKELQTLVLNDMTLATDSEIDNLSLLPKLESVVFMNVPLSNTQIESLAKLTKLTQLGIVGTPLDRQDIAALQSLTQLRSLDLSDTKLPDVALSEVAAFKRLQYLDLSANPLSSDDLLPLAALKDLQTLNFYDMPPTGKDFDISVLQSAMPRCEIKMQPLEGVP